MNTHHDTIQRILRAVGEASLGMRLRPGSLKLEVSLHEDRESLATKIATFGASQGWAQYSDAIVAWQAGQQLEASRLLLSAELVAGLRSLHIQRVHKYWRCTLVSEVADTSGHQHLRRVTHKAREGFEALHYDVYWDTQANPNAPIFARLVAVGEHTS